MESEFSITEVRLINSLLSKETDSDIAALLDRPVEDVAAKIHELTGGKSTSEKDKILLSRKQREKKATVLKSRRANKELQKRKALQAEKVKEKKEQQNAIRVQQESLRRKRNEPLFETKSIDYSQLMTVRIDEKTLVYAKPGQNEKQVRDRYFKSLRRPDTNHYWQKAK